MKKILCGIRYRSLYIYEHGVWQMKKILCGISCRKRRRRHQEKTEMDPNGLVEMTSIHRRRDADLYL